MLTALAVFLDLPDLWRCYESTDLTPERIVSCLASSLSPLPAQTAHKATSKYWDSICLWLHDFASGASSIAISAVVGVAASVGSLPGACLGVLALFRVKPASGRSSQSDIH
jgi:hypothetical protein